MTSMYVQGIMCVQSCNSILDFMYMYVRTGYYVELNT